MVTVLMNEQSGSDTVAGWRCLLCGEAIDPGIEGNRMSHDQPLRSRARVPGSPAAGSVKRKSR